MWNTLAEKCEMVTFRDKKLHITFLCFSLLITDPAADSHQDVIWRQGSKAQSSEEENPQVLNSMS